MPQNPPHSSPFTGNASFGASKSGSAKAERRGKSGGGSGTPSSSRPRKAHDRTHERAPQPSGAVNYDDEYHAHATGQRNFAMESRAFLQQTAFGEFDEDDAFTSGQFMDDGDAFPGNSSLLRNSAQAPSGGGAPPGASFWKVSYSRAVAASRFYRNQALIAEVLNETCVPDVRSVVTTQRLHVLRKQVASLEAHQLKLEAELGQLTEKHDAKKRRIVESFSTLRSDYSRASADRQRYATLSDPKSDVFRALVDRYKAEYSKAVAADSSSGSTTAQHADSSQSHSPTADSTKKDTSGDAPANAGSTDETQTQSRSIRTPNAPAPESASEPAATSSASDDGKLSAEQLIAARNDTTTQNQPDGAASGATERDVNASAQQADRDTQQTSRDEQKPTAGAGADAIAPATNTDSNSHADA